MTEISGPEDQNQEVPEPAVDQAPASPPNTPIPQPESSSSPIQAETDTQTPGPLSLPPKELEDEDDDQEEVKAQPTDPDLKEVAQQKERLEKQARWEDISSEQQELIKQRENQRLIESGKRNIMLMKIEPRKLLEVDKLFVEPEGYQNFVQDIEQSTEAHILIVAGQERSGKLMTAIYLAQHLWQKKAPEVYLFADRSNKTLLEVVSDEKLPRNAVILFEEVFDQDQLILSELTHRYVNLNDDLINLGNVWFIFTVLHGPRFEALQARNFPTLHTTEVNCQQVMGKLIDYVFQENLLFEDQRAKLLKAKESLSARLTPADVRQLFDAKRDDLPVLIEALTRPEMEHKSPDLWFLEHKAPDLWFNELKPMNYQLYALLVVLFDKLDMPMLEEVYTIAANALRRQGMDSPDEFIDPRRIGTNLMHNKLGIQVDFNVLKFRNRIYRQYVEEQVENFQRLLWSLIDPDDPSTFAGLIGIIQGLSDYDFQLMRDERYTASSDLLWQLRYAIAAMIAQVGVYHLNKLHLLLNKLVSDVSPLVALTAAFVLAEIARKGKHFEFIERVLNAWCQSGRFEQMWAAASSISFIYEAIARPLEDDPDEQQDKEDEEEQKKTVDEEQKPRRRGHLAKLRDMLTDLVKIHDHFSEKAIDEERRRMYDTYRARLRQQLEVTLDPILDTERLFRDMNEVEQEQVFNIFYAESKKAIDEVIKRDIAALTNSWKNQMRIALMQTLGIIAQMWPLDVTRLIRVWLDRKDTESPLWQIGHMALNYLFRESWNMKDASRLEQSAYPLLKLLPMAMRTHKLTMEAVLHDMNLFLQIETLQETGTLGEHLEVGNLLAGDPLIYALYAIQRWYENLSQLTKQQEKKKGEERTSEEDEEDEEETPDGSEENIPRKKWQQTVYTVLSDAMNSAPQEERQRLRQALFLWIRSGEPMLGHIARILISHSYVMDGIVLDLPVSKRAGIVVIDNSRRDREDRDRIFYLLQRLSSIAPLHLHWLGYTRSSRFLSSEDRKEVGKTHEVEKISSLDPDDLLLRGANRPSLLLPVLTSGQGYVPERSYFVAVFHTEPILDLEDLYPGFAVPREEREDNIFQKLHQLREAAVQARSQPWQGKVYLLPSAEKFTIPTALSSLLTVVYPESFGLVEEELRRQVTITLRSCSAEELWSDLRTYIGTPETQPRTFERLAGEIERWLEQLSDTSTLYPDVSLFILWTIMAWSREDLGGAIQLIELLLGENVEGGEDKTAKKFRKLKQQMGIASARMLFHFYGADNPTLASKDYGILLDLLPRVIACATSYTEILPILSVLFQLARTGDWLQLLNENEGAFFECISKVALKDLAPLRDWLKDDQQLIAMLQLFLDYNRPFSNFRAFGDDVFRRYKAPQPKQQARKEVQTQPGEMDSKFLAILPADNTQEERGRYTWALQQIAFQEARLRNPDTTLATLAGLKNLEVLLNHVANELQSRLDGTIERLKEGEYYGIVMVEAQSKAAVHQAFLVLQEFVKLRRESKRQQVTLMLQRLGDKEVLAKVRNNRKIKNEREISDKRKLPQVIGPLLERYPADQVAFVLLITASPIVDYDDWAEQDQWSSRLWVARLGKWHPYHGEIAALGESTQLTLENILKRSEGE